MKYIFDFDDVLFNNTAQFKEHAFRVIAKVGVPLDYVKEYYSEIRKQDSEFSLKDFIATLFERYNVIIDEEKVYESIMSECSKFINVPLVEWVKKIGKDNCYIVSNGNEYFQHNKIKDSGLAPLFDEIFIVPGSKKEIIYDICDKNKNEKVIFIDNRNRFFKDLDFKKCPNLKTILYTGQNVESLLEEINK